MARLAPARSTTRNQTEVMQALVQFKTLKIGCASSALQQVVGNDNGWFLTGTCQDGNEDHCVGIYDYGTAAFLANAYGVSVPAGVDPNTFCLGLCTWGTIGVIDWQSFLNITGESWVRENDPDRADAAEWDLEAASAYSDVSGTPPSPAPSPSPPPNPQPPTQRAIVLAHQAFERYQHEPEIVLRILARLEAELMK